ncbi:MAG: hypothetical protein ISR58_16155 [Anaerolineales bacterium]|nr:hypothetical protein [Chloroflexota bacterium]MBL6982708.1 hypothetical protein [Anaerolineales bacterium]
MSKPKQMILVIVMILIGGFLSSLLYAVTPTIDKKLGSEVAWSVIGLCLSLYTGLVLFFLDFFPRRETFKGKFEEYALRPWSHKIYTFSDHDTKPEFIAFPGSGGIKKKLPGRKSKRGRKSRYGDEVERRTVLKWEALDPSVTPMTLEEFLVQEFGTAGGGIPNASTSAFYDWRKKVLEDL